MTRSFKLDIETIRTRAIQSLADGALTDSYTAPRAEVIDILNEVLATELVCNLRYRSNQFVARRLGALRIAEEFAQHAAEEAAHLDQVANRIDQLGGLPNFNPAEVVARSHARYASPTVLETAVRENLIAERIAVDTYSQIIRWLGDRDPTTRRMMEDILAQEEEHAADLTDLLERVKRFEN